jgi:predicted glycoside hydrolase/deacetylase ChbG (UPF0249 family)
MPRLIVNADDLSIHPLIDEGIKLAYINGIVTSTTMLVTTEFCEKTVDNIVKPTGIPVGLHLNLTMGTSCANPELIPDLVDENQCFKYTPIRLYKDLFVRKADPKLLSQVYIELESQFKKSADIGVSFTHFDSHQNVHFIPVVFNMIKQIASRYGFSKARMGRELLYDYGVYDQKISMIRRKNPLKWFVTRYCMSKIRHGLVSSDFFFGILCSGILSKKTVIKFMRCLIQDATYEMAIHAGLAVKRSECIYRSNFNDFICSPARKKEYEITIDEEIKEQIKKEKIELISYKDL